MPLKAKSAALLAKTESTYGTDSVPAGATDAMLVTNIEINPLEGDSVERETMTGKPGNNMQLLAGNRVTVTFGVEIQGAGTKGTAPAYAALLKACALSETITPTTKVEYTPVNTNEQSVTMYVFRDGIRHKITGARGSVKYSMAIGAIPKMEFTLTGLYNAPDATPNPALTLTGFLAPKVFTNGLGSFSLGGYQAKLDSFEFDQANEVTYHELIGATSVEITNRKPAGTVTIECPTLGQKNYFADVIGEALVPFNVTHGTVDGRIVELLATQLQLGRPSYSEKNGVLMLQMPFSVIDDYILRVR